MGEGCDVRLAVRGVCWEMAGDGRGRGRRVDEAGDGFLM